MVKPFFNLRDLRQRSADLAATLQNVQRSAGRVTGQMQDGRSPTGLVREILARALPIARPTAPREKTSGGIFLAGSFTAPSGTRPYRLFVPDHPAPRPALIVMLHGCTQTPEDFAAGTRMNMLARAAGAFVLYPAQTAGANPQRCWNWFNPADQQRDDGESALIAAMTRAIAAEHRIDPALIFAAGLSAGGAQAAILGAKHPDLFAAIGVHSGLACGAARDVSSAMTAMRRGGAGQGTYPIRTIIFHGDRDATVAPANADAVAAQFAPATSGTSRTEHGQAPGGLAYTRTISPGADGRTALEHWTVQGAGHAWSGGSPDGTYTEPRGPDASKAMLNFFLS